MAMTGTAGSVRKPAIAAVRGSILTLHSAAGLATPVNREATRMLRASEGLARAALALLEATGRQPAASPAGQPGECGAKRNGRKNSKASKGNANGDNKGKGKGKGGSGQAEAPFGDSPAGWSWAAPSGAMPMDTGAAAALSDDEWADTVVQRGPRPPGGGVPPLVGANDPEGRRDSLPVVFGPATAPPGWRDELPETPLGPAHRTCSARRSSSRSPRREDVAQPPATLAPPLVTGQLAVIQLLAKRRAELNGEKVRLAEFDSSAGRWVCARSNGEKVRIPSEKLQALHAASQARAEQDYLKDGGT